MDVARLAPGLLFAAVGTAIVGAAWAALARRLAWMAPPGPRRHHQDPVPTSGGLALGAVVAITIASLGAPSSVVPLACLCAGLGVLGLLDDRWELGPATLAIVQLGAVALYAWAALPAQSWGWNLVAALALMACINFVNFLDGIDGLVPAVASVLLVSLGVLHPPLRAVAFISAAGLAGFLWLNRPPARVFLGNSGAYALGAWLGGLALSSSAPSGIGWGFAWPLLVLMPALADPMLTVVSRVLRGERWWTGHREHLYQRLHDGGWSVGAVVSLWSAWSALSLALVLTRGWWADALAGWVAAFALQGGVAWAVYRLAHRVRAP